MRDDYLTQDYADRRPTMTASIAALFRAIGIGLARLNARQFDAPWRPRALPCGTAR